MAGVPVMGEELLLGSLVLAALAGFAVGRWLSGEKLRGAEWRIRRAEAMCTTLRETADDYRRRLRVRSPQQAEKKLNDHERKLAMLRFQVASLSSELKSMRAAAPGSGEHEIIDLTGTSSRRISEAKRRR